ncbi:MAG: hypothetical protein ACD_10C00575G0005 [uncultured bacterium]|nr:MAG: hypothetical protein ACD_10C00575G0005 [uncultured bacterium]
MILRLTPCALVACLLTACGTTPSSLPEATVNAQNGPLSKMPTPTRKPTAVLKRGGGFYKDDGPADDIPDGLDDIPDAAPKWEPLHKPATKPYFVLGQSYVPNTTLKPYKARGIASWYGKKFHGQKTSIGQPYDMFAMTAAHPTLALPSYVRVTQLQSGKSVIVRVIDRGPFHADRIIDLSYTAAYKLGLINGGSGEVEVEAILPGDFGGTTYAQVLPPALPAVAEPDNIEQIARRTELPSPPVPPVTVARADALAAPPKGIHLQLGAFANLDNAENLKSQIAHQFDWLSERLSITLGNGLHRLQLGPYASRSDANRIAEKISAALGYKPTLVIR